MTQHVEAFRYARLAARTADEKLGENITALDVRRESSLADCFLLVTGSSHIHIRALEDAVRDTLQEAGANLKRTDGQRGHVWRALDYGSLIVHIMDQKTRDFYAIERLWEKGKPVDWADKVKSTPSKKKPLARKRSKK